jgi:hypothetical protein
VQDPDGNEWEAFVVLEDNLPVTSTCCVPEADAVGEATAAGAAATSKAGAAMTRQATAETSSCCATAAPLSISR